MEVEDKVHVGPEGEDGIIHGAFGVGNGKIDFGVELWENERRKCEYKGKGKRVPRKWLEIGRRRKAGKEGPA